MTATDTTHGTDLAMDLAAKLATAGACRVRMPDDLLSDDHVIDPRVGLRDATQDRPRWLRHCESDGYDLGVWQDSDGDLWVLRYDPAGNSAMPLVLHFCGDDEAVDSLLGTTAE